MPFIAGFTLFGMGVMALVRLVLSHPVATAALIIGLALLGSCQEHMHVGGFDAASAMSATPDTIEQFTGTPESCADAGEVICSNDYSDVHMIGQRVTQIDWKRLNGQPFNTDAKFYARVLGYLNIPYREPDVATIDKIVWRVPGVGTITATSDSEMNVEGIVIRG